MSYNAMRWAMGQDVTPALTKFLLVAMAECVNAEEETRTGQMIVWPSYARLAQRTGMNTKTVEVGVFRLKEIGYLVDTGKRAGNTGKVVVYRLNDPKGGVILPGPQDPNANGTRPQNDPETGAIGGEANPPKFDANPPKNDVQSPQKVEEIPPKTVVGIRNGTKNRTRKEPGSDAAVAAIPGVPPQVLSDWLTVRKDKRAGTLTATAVEGLEREAAKAGVSVEDAVRYCINQNWIGFNAGWYADRTGSKPAGGIARPNAQEALEASNRAVLARYLERDQ